MQVGTQTMWRPPPIEKRTKTRWMFAFSVEVMYAIIIQHDRQDVAGRLFENVKNSKLLFWSLLQDRHAIAMSRGGMRKRRHVSSNLHVPSSGNVCIRILWDAILCHTTFFYFFGCPKLERQHEHLFYGGFLGRQMLTGTVRHVFIVQIGLTTIPCKT